MKTQQIESFYVSPERKKDHTKTDFFTSTNEKINSFRKKDIILVQCDLNARTGCEQEFIKSDKFDDSLGIKNSGNRICRNSEDKLVNQRGKELLDLCKVNYMLISRQGKGHFSSNRIF